MGEFVTGNGGFGERFAHLHSHNNNILKIIAIRMSTILQKN